MVGQRNGRLDFARVYEENYVRIFGFIYGRTNDVELSKDLTADSFLRAYQRLHALKEPFAVSSWLYKIAASVTVNYFRVRKREERRQLKADRPAAPLDPADIVEEAYDAVETLALLRRLEPQKLSFLAAYAGRKRNGAMPARLRVRACRYRAALRTLVAESEGRIRLPLGSRRGRPSLG